MRKALVAAAFVVLLLTGAVAFAGPRPSKLVCYNINEVSMWGGKIVVVHDQKICVPLPSGGLTPAAAQDSKTQP